MSYLRKSNGELYKSFRKPSDVGTAHCPDCLKHFEDCECLDARGGIFTRSNTKPDLKQLDSKNMWRGKE